MVHLLITISLVVRSCITGTFSLYIVSSLSFDIDIIFLYNGKASQTHFSRDANLCWYASSVMESKIDLSILEICMAISYFTFIKREM